MCQVMGYAGRDEARPRLLAGLTRVERDDEDAAGVCLLADGGLELFRAVARVETLRVRVRVNGAPATVGIAHTHARGCEHPLVTGDVAVAFHGFTACCRPAVTDEALVAQLVADNYEGDLGAAVEAACAQLDGRFAFLALHAQEPGTLAAASRGTSLLAASGAAGTYFASSAAALPAGDVFAIDGVATASAAGLRVVA